jgi:hypothetical protein
MWLGLDISSQAQSAVELIRKINTNWDTGTHNPERPFPSNEQLQARGLPTRPDPRWDALAYLLELPYFSRMWIVQEARVARRGLIVWGNCMLDRAELMRTIAWLSIGFARQSSGEHSGISTEEAIGTLFKSHTSLSALLEVTRGHKSRDPRVRYYALLGLYDRKPLFGTKARNFLKADYSKSLSKVLCEVTETEGNLNVLSHAGYRGKESGTPSWAAIWGQDLDEEYERPLSAELNNYKTTRDTESIVANLGDLDVLQVQGILVGKVVAHTGKLKNLEIMLSIEEAWKLALEHVPQPIDLFEFVLALTAGQSVQEDNSTGKPTELSHLLDFAVLARALAAFELLKSPREDARKCPRLIMELGSRVIEKVKGFGRAS